MREWMTLIGDLHGRVLSVQRESRCLVLAGDIAPDGGIERQLEWLDGPFRGWMENLANRDIACVAVPGNHDIALDTEAGLCIARTIRNFALLIPPGNACVVEGVSFWGMPYVLDGGAYKGSEEQIEAALAGMPSRVDCLLSHNPPLGILDRPSLAKHIGSLALRYAIWKKRPKLAVFGHVHEARGWIQVGETYCVNATLGAGCNKTNEPVPAPHGPWGLSDNSWRKD